MAAPVADPFLNPLFMPHGHCYLWDPPLLWTQVIANLLIAVAYFSIPVALWVFVTQRRDLKNMQVKGLFIMFALFILFCGITHVMDVVVTWKPYYWIDALVRVIAAMLSLGTAVAIWPLIPRLLALPSPAQLAAVNAELQEEVQQRKAHEEEISALNLELEQRVRDRTEELAQRTREAESANRSKSIFLATVSHELRTPLNAIIGYSELMIEDIGEARQDGARQCEDLSHVRDSALHLLTLINEVLDLSRIEANKVDIIEEDVSIAALLEDLRRTILPLAETNANRLEVESTQPDLLVKSDYHRLKQILLNLLSNACKFTHQGLVRLEVSETDGRLCFRVSDNGIGIPSEHLTHIFEMFYQADSSYSRKYMGTGLGLTIARGLAERLGGSLEVESEPGKGTVFSVNLPLQRIAKTAPLPA